MNVVFALCEAATPQQIGGKKPRKNYFKFIFLYMKINSKLQITVSLIGVTLKLIVILLVLASSWRI